MKLFGLIQLTKRLFGALTKGEEMAKEEIVQAGVGAIQSGVVQVYSDELGKAYDAGFGDGVASVPPSTGGGFSQADIDAAVASARAEDQALLDQTKAEDQKAFDDAKALADQAIADLQGKFEALAQKEGQEAQVIDGLKVSLEQMKSVVAILSGLFPQPEPQPEPVPEA